MRRSSESAGAFPALTPHADPIPVGTGAPRAPRRATLPSARLVGPLLAIALVLVLPAIVNRYPLLYSDSGEYLVTAFDGRPPRFRIAGYGAWIFATGGTLTAWGPIVAQSLLLAALLLRALIASGIVIDRRSVAVVSVTLLLTGAPWTASELMPDAFAGVVVLAVYLVIAHWPRLGGVWRGICASAIVLGCATHTSNPIVVGALLAALALLGRVRGLALPPLRALGRAAALVALSLAGLALFNLYRTDHLRLTRNGSVFLAGHLVESGLAERVLAERCERERFALCPYRVGLTRPIERFIWESESPFYRAYESEAELRDDTRRLALTVLVHEPLRLGGSVIAYGARQFVSVEVFDAVRTRPVNDYSRAAVEYILPHEGPALARARQQQSGLGAFAWLDPLILAALLGAVAVAAWVVGREMRRRPLVLDGACGMLLFVLLALAVNACVCANLSSVFGRYQGRVAWLLPVLVAAAMAGRRGGPAAPEAASGR